MTTQSTTFSEVIPQWTLLDRLKKARTYAGLTQTQLAAKTGIGLRSISNYESGDTPIKRPALLSWALACQVNLRWLADGISPPGGPASKPPNAAYSRSKVRTLVVRHASSYARVRCGIAA